MHPPLSIVCPVWSPEYVARLDRFCLASLLAPGNLPAWPYREHTTLLLYTKPQDVERIQALHTYQQLSQLINIEIPEIDIDILDHINAERVINSYMLMTLCHQHALQQVCENGHAIMFMQPDLIFSQDTFAKLAALIEHGKTLVFMLSFRVTEEALMSSETTWSTPLSWDEQTCLAHSLRYIHPENKAYFWLDPLFNTGHSSTVYAWENDHTLVGHSYEYMPFYIRDPRPFPPSVVANYDTFDGQYVAEYEHLLTPQHTSQLAIANQQGIYSLSVTPALHVTSDWGNEASLAQRPNLMYQFMRPRYKQNAMKHWLFQQKMILPFNINVVEAGFVLPTVLQRYQQFQKTKPWLAAEIIWQIEQSWLAGAYDHVLLTYDSHQHILDSIQEPHLHFVYYYVAASLAHSGRWEPLSGFVARYQRQLLTPALYLAAHPPLYEGYQTPGLWPDVMTDLHGLCPAFSPGPHSVLFFDDKQWAPQTWQALPQAQRWLFIGSREDWQTAGLAAEVQHHLAEGQWIWIDALSISERYGLGTKEFLHWSLDAAERMAIVQPCNSSFVDLIIYALLRGKEVAFLPVS